MSRRPRSTAAERALWKQRFVQSGLLPRQFAAQHGLRLSTLQRWVASLHGVSPATPGGHTISFQPNSPHAAPGFTEITRPVPGGLSASSSSSPWAAELVRPDGSTLRLARDVSGPLLKQLLRSC